MHFGGIQRYGKIWQETFTFEVQEKTTIYSALPLLISTPPFLPFYKYANLSHFFCFYTSCAQYTVFPAEKYIFHPIDNISLSN
jgi:hypothetical protein